MIDVDFALHRKNFDIAIKECFSSGITGIYGSSGSGKTSLLHAIAGLAHPHSGKISIGARTVFNANERMHLPVEQRNIGYVFQEGRLFPHMSVEKNLRYGTKKGQAQNMNFNEVVDMLNLSHLLNSKPTSISGGERQRTALGRALLSSPEILLLDEPFSAVDTRLREQILPFLLKIQKRVNIPILVVSHDLPDLLKLTNKLCIIKQGKCIGHADYHELLKKPEVADVFGTGAIVNSVRMQVEQVNSENGLTQLFSGSHENRVRVICEKSKLNYTVGEWLQLFINSDDIALSSEKVFGLTIQNQLEGIITDIIPRNNATLCIVDVGFRLVVEITAASRNRMEIVEGSRVWCLFKSVAIDVAG